VDNSLISRGKEGTRGSTLGTGARERVILIFERAREEGKVSLFYHRDWADVLQGEK